MNNHNRYCENCDKWLDNSDDYEAKKIGRSDDIGTTWEYTCKTCGSKAISEQLVSGSYSACGLCYKQLIDEEE
jgi:predicted SprT family Zn-dependent metalloprotease